MNDVSTNKDLARTIQYLKATFESACSSADLTKDQVRSYQVDFAYIIDDIERGPTYAVPKRVSDANRLIALIKDN